MRRLQPVQGALIAASAGALTVYAFAPWRLWPLILISLVVLLRLIQAQPERAFSWAYWWGLASFSANFYWIYYSLHDVAGLPSWIAAPMVALLPAWLALFPALAVWASARGPFGSAHWRWGVAFPALWVLTEWLRATVFTGFPWASLGYSQIPNTPLAALAPLGGIYAVSAAVALTAGLLSQLRQPSFVAWRWPVIVLLGLWGGSSLSGQYTWTHPVGVPTTVSLIQGNIPQSLKWEESAYASTLQQYGQQILSAKGELIVLPETAFPVFFDQLPADYLGFLRQHLSQRQQTLLTGAVLQTPQGGYVNAALSLHQPQHYYAKNHLVPFGEFIPLPAITGWIYQQMNMPLSGFTRGGDNQPPLTLAKQRIAVNICYEDGFGDELRGSAAQATVLANLSNLAWFGHSSAAEQQLQLSQARALESGRPMLRATNTGATAIISADGNIQAQLPAFTTAILEDHVQGYQGQTPYMRWGDSVVLWLSGLALLISGLRHRRASTL